ncbi:RIP metalloprotease RseP [Erysipelatoclostridium sp. An15]|uniref:Site-2 protease family protein n=1 Tax=Candidatus Erysipelatoclostridium merdavium TaxID=2838566 RepID=A0A9D1XN85_9FIRM|nr:MULTISPECIES: M50 family metallopeptidase [unclassified Thomasclavelia]OUP79076.1 RIP metalloprotease RseP [Erysipelatoclostridium sp. An173]OUQ09300.1 RIP metalloprotease RseP [Erysipelatoclostridium sp. An15]HIX82668.1 site-2 protease family protein [Candidatus Erysipelatoclostridium merdavium]
MQTLINIIVFILILGIVVLIHEFGHFITAKSFGVYCSEFSIGMGPKLFSKKIGETEYEIRALPIGGFVSMAGEADNEIEEFKDVPFERTINGISCWKKVVVFLAGVFMNFILSIVILIGVYSFIEVQDNTPVIGSVSDNGPAMMAGIEAGDRITKIAYDGEEYIIGSYDDIREVMGKIESDDKTVTVEVELVRDSKTLTKQVNAQYSEESGMFILGVISGTRQLSFFEAVNYAFDQFKTLSLLIFTTLGQLFTDTANTIGQLSGPAGIYSTTAQITATGSISQLLIFLALISTNVGIFNLLPIPGLDGCQVIFALVEKMIGRELPLKLRYALQLAGLALVFALLIYVTINDVSRILG